MGRRHHTRRQWIDAEIHVDAGRRFTTVIVKGSRFTGIGVAKRHPDDAFRLQTGVDIATARALRDLAEQLRNNWS
jgi:hypothetical protein